MARQRRVERGVRTVRGTLIQLDTGNWLLTDEHVLELMALKRDVSPPVYSLLAKLADCAEQIVAAEKVGRRLRLVTPSFADTGQTRPGETWDEHMAAARAALRPDVVAEVDRIMAEQDARGGPE